MNNTESPLIPQGSLLEQKNKSRVRVKIAVFFVLAIHGLGLMALLMLGCQKEKEPAQPLAATPLAPETNAAPTLEPTNLPTLPSAAESNTAPATSAVAAAQTPVQPPVTLEPAQPPAPVPSVGGMEYKVVKGDTLAKIAKKAHVSLQALQSANPTVDSSKLKIGQSLQIPAPAPAMSSPAPSVGAAGTTEPAATGGEQSYTVKSGDSLTKIAGQFKVSAKALRSANSLKTDKIKVGQKLKIPGKPAAPAAPANPVPAPEPSGAMAPIPAH